MQDQASASLRHALQKCWHTWHLGQRAYAGVTAGSLPEAVLAALCASRWHSERVLCTWEFCASPASFDVTTLTFCKQPGRRGQIRSGDDRGHKLVISNLLVPQAQARMKYVPTPPPITQGNSGSGGGSTWSH